MTPVRKSPWQRHLRVPTAVRMYRGGGRTRISFIRSGQKPEGETLGLRLDEALTEKRIPLQIL